jgi:muramoyltetrapeptide carboxypeptidase LdcA involved in peptidoglycan recycling
VPILAGYPGGHGAENWALPLGAKVRLDADGSSIQIIESAVVA